MTTDIESQEAPPLRLGKATIAKGMSASMTPMDDLAKQGSVAVCAGAVRRHRRAAREQHEFDDAVPIGT
jgi:hypothetical protein